MGAGIHVRGRGRDLDRPVVGRAVAQERQGQVVRPAEAVIDLDIAGEGRLDAGGAGRAVPGVEVAGGVGAGEYGGVGVEVGAERDRGRGGGQAVDAADVDGLQRVDVDDRLVGVERPALQVVARGRAQVALEVGRERAGAGVELLALAVGRRVDDEEAGARDGDVGRRGAALDQALGRHRVEALRAHAARAVAVAAAAAGDEVLELRQGTLVGGGVHVGDVVGDHAHRPALGVEARTRRRTGNRTGSCVYSRCSVDRWRRYAASSVGCGSRTVRTALIGTLAPATTRAIPSAPGSIPSTMPVRYCSAAIAVPSARAASTRTW